ncbi:MAG: tRNA (adenine-N1)-methyltransferase [Actinobacteria bacterium]|nr:tRNA (adenine-N1)-methyltransferase [Actinomycetota bacterium]
MPFPGSRSPLQAGERVVLRDRKGRRYLVTLEDDGEWHSHAGFIRHEELIGRPEGSAVRTSKNMEVTALRPTREDVTLKMPRGAQVVYPKDQALIVGFGDIRPGCTVVEAGAGSGALTLSLLQAVGPTGRVISYERREDHLEVAEENVTTYLGGHPNNWDLRLGDLADALPELDCDRVVLDVLDPWELVGGVGDTLHPGGLMVVYTPTITQVMRLVESLDEDGRFAQTRTFETLLRTWNVEGLSVRPDHRMVAHTAFLTVTRRVLSADEGGPGSSA